MISIYSLIIFAVSKILTRIIKDRLYVGFFVLYQPYNFPKKTLTLWYSSIFFHKFGKIHSIQRHYEG